jgi:hypothetical protein
MLNRDNWHARYYFYRVCNSALVENERAKLLHFISTKLAAGPAVTCNNCNTNRQDISWLSCIGPAVAIHGFFDWFQFITAFVYHSASSNPDHAFDLALFFITLAPFGFAYLAYKVMLVNALPVFAGRFLATAFLCSLFFATTFLFFLHSSFHVPCTHMHNACPSPCSSTQNSVPLPFSTLPFTLCPPPPSQVVWVQWELLNRDLGLSEDWEHAAISWK